MELGDHFGDPVFNRKLRALAGALASPRVSADDLVQAALVSILSQRNGRSVTTSLLLCMSRRAMRAEQRRERKYAEPLEPLGDHDGFAPLDGEVGTDPRMAQLGACLHGLNEADRDLLFLHFRSRLSVRQIARRQRISKSSVDRHLHKALAHCRKLMTA